jgi:hypothetical protein
MTYKPLSETDSLKTIDSEQKRLLNFRDTTQTFYIMKRSRTLRFSNNEVISNIENVIDQVGHALLKHNI